jgi:predicted GIY-YIG superfamily endonuclease
MVYILHFDRPYKHAYHYIGFTAGGLKALQERMEEHRTGRGANLMRVISEAGIGFTVTGTRKGGRREERRIKVMGGACRVCPHCNPNSKVFKKQAFHFDPETGMQCNALRINSSQDLLLPASTPD